MTKQPKTCIQFLRYDGACADIWTTENHIDCVIAGFNSGHLEDECETYFSHTNTTWNLRDWSEYYFGIGCVEVRFISECGKTQAFPITKFFWEAA